MFDEQELKLNPQRNRRCGTRINHLWIGEFLLKNKNE